MKCVIVSVHGHGLTVEHPPDIGAAAVVVVEKETLWHFCQSRLNDVFTEFVLTDELGAIKYVSCYCSPTRIVSLVSDVPRFDTMRSCIEQIRVDGDAFAKLTKLMSAEVLFDTSRQLKRVNPMVFVAGILVPTLLEASVVVKSRHKEASTYVTRMCIAVR